MLIKYLEENNIERLALVGTNSQGKSYAIAQELKGAIGKQTILVANEVKADENLKNSADSSTLISWLNTLLDNTNAKQAIQDEIDKIDLSSINDDSFLNISIKNNLDSYKGIVNAEIKTDSNQWNKPGAGERFLGQLLLISKILEDNPDETYKYLVIDEPEQHLHPSLYIKVAKILKKISTQGIKVIIATHSPVITQYFIDDTNELCKVVDGTFNFLPKIDELMTLSQSFDCYQKDELKLKHYTAIETKYSLYFRNFVLPIILKALFCNCMLLGEGAIERKVFDVYLLKYGSTMKKNDVDYAIVDGKVFFPLVISVLKKIGTKVITMHDLDDEGNPLHVYLNNTIGELSDKVITFKPNIETFLGITKEMCNDKYMGSIILINEFYLDDNEKLNELLEMINNTIEIVVKN